MTTDGPGQNDILAYGGLRYYRPSGRVHVPTFVFLMGLMLACIVAFGYEWAAESMDRIWSRMGLLLVYAAVHAVIVYVCVVSARVRNPPLLFALTFLAGVLSVVLIWAWHLSALTREWSSPLGLVGLITRYPDTIWLIKWVLAHDASRLGVPWAVESAALILPSMLMVRRGMKFRARCERCGRLMTAKLLANTHVGVDEEMRGAMEQGDFEKIMALGDCGDAREWYRVSVEHCKSCRGERLLCVERCKPQQTHENKAKWIVPRLIISDGEYGELVKVCERVSREQMI